MSEDVIKTHNIKRLLLKSMNCIEAKDLASPETELAVNQEKVQR